MKHPLRRLFADRPEIIRPRGEELTRLEGFSDAVFGFAVTLLVVSLKVPRDYADLMRLFSGLPAFGVTFLLLCGIWREHYRYFRRYGLEDRVTTLLNSALLFVVVAYIYPLKFMFNAAFSWIPGAVQIHLTRAQGAQLLVVYSLGFAAVQLCLGAMYLHATRLGDALELTPVEVSATRFHGTRHGLLGGVALLAAVVAAVLLRSTYGTTVASACYLLIWPLRRLNRRQFDRRRAALPDPTPGVAP